MGEIKEFIISLISAASVSAIVEGLLPEGTELKKYTKYIISLIILLMLISPLIGIAGKVPDLLDGTEFSYDSVDAIARTNSIIAMHIEKAVCEKFELSGDEVDVTCESGEIIVICQKRTGIFASDLSRFIELNFGITAEVKIDA